MTLSIIEQILLGLALAMDCFSVSIATGLLIRKFEWKVLTPMCLLFGLFQALMPTIGWICTIYFGPTLTQYGHIIAFLLLAFIGTKMIIDYFKGDEAKQFDPHKISVILLLSIATSIDALAVGASFTCMGLNTFDSIVSPIATIGIMSTLMSVVGATLGILLGKKFRFPAELIGGIILIGIGIKILI